MRLPCILLAVALAAGAPTLSAAQTSPARARFDRFDANRDGELREEELALCGCHSLDADADEGVTFEEFQRPEPAVVGTYELVEVAGRRLPAQAEPGDETEMLAARLTLYSTGILALRVTAREPGARDTTVTRVGRYQLSGDRLTLWVIGEQSSAAVSGGVFKIQLAWDAPWMLWRRIEAVAPARPRGE